MRHLSVADAEASCLHLSIIGVNSSRTSGAPNTSTSTQRYARSFSLVFEGFVGQTEAKLNSLIRSSNTRSARCVSAQVPLRLNCDCSETRERMVMSPRPGTHIDAGQHLRWHSSPCGQARREVTAVKESLLADQTGRGNHPDFSNPLTTLDSLASFL